MKILKYKYNPNKRGVFRISVVPKPAVGEGDLVLMSADLIEMESQEIKGVFYAPVMIPDLKITRINEATKEKYQVYYDAETVEQLANNYWKQCGNRNTNLDHADENTDGIYPVESWIVKDPVQDKSKALGMPEQKIGTWIMAYKADSPEVLEKIKNNLLQGLSIEGNLDAEEEVNVKFNKHQSMFDTLKKGIADLFVKMEAEGEPKEKTTEELATEEAAKTAEMEAEKTPEEIEAEKKAEEEKGAPDELEAVKAENEELKKKVSDLEAELAKVANEAVLMSAQIEEVNTKFEAYKTVKMSSQSLADQEKKTVVLTDAEVKHSKFLEDVYSKVQ